ncbi:type 1 glutamine amidotransferase domain-containing protein [Ekhidna sp.]|jgi:putative intracellular protease/amidase|uniref:type 1 glutamine amidotransferase domain-containing protein n=1 Tax=Ekhidna sp. TaxID=2608089 RepID=UPI0032ED140A
MSKAKKIIKRSAITIVILVISLTAFGYWFMGLIVADKPMYEGITETVPSDLTYLTNDSVEYRGKILAVVTSTAEMGTSGKSTGYELTELSRAYYVFMANGFEVEVASPLGGQPPVVIDDDDVGRYDYAFMNDSTAQFKVNNTLALADLNPSDYEAVYFVGGKGAMYDFPENASIQKLVRELYENDKVVGAVCHGPAALVNVTLSDGKALLANKTVSSFTNEEEFFLIPDASEIFPFLLQDKLIESGASFQEGAMYLENVVVGGKLVTGQNPWSTWTLAESMIEALGHKPKSRPITAEENSVAILNAYAQLGYDPAKQMLEQNLNEGTPIHRELLAVHSIVSSMQWELGTTIDLIRLLAHAKSKE